MIINLDSTIIRTKTAASLLNLLIKCKKYLRMVDSRESIYLQQKIDKAEKIYEDEMSRSKK
tara:strand:- start:2525 stop:2707 length:183 start_codon:yes stop_codon:yes gene_type:complete